MKETLTRIIADEDGQGMVEYGLIIAGVAAAVIAAIAFLSPMLETKFGSLDAVVNGTTTP